MYKDSLVELKGERFLIEMMYAKPENMSGRAVYQEIGYGNQAWLHPELEAKMQQLLPWLQEHHFKMKICDAYRPPLAHRILKEIIPQPGFFASDANRSQHCHGTAVDVLLCEEDGTELPYPTRVDAYAPILAQQVQRGKMDNFMEHLKKARHDYNPDSPALQQALYNREQLRVLMENLGLESISFEWWHYDLPHGRDEDLYPMVEF